jgi:cellulose 1,4-beta-cellobiosidase
MRRKLALMSVVAIAATTGAVAIAQQASAAAGCTAKYTVTGQWQGGFQAQVDVTNLGDATTSWTVGWDFGNASQTITQIWNADKTQTGTHVNATSLSYNGNVATNGTLSFGFLGNWSGANPAGTNLTLNGIACNGGTTPTTPGSPSASATKSASPSASPSTSTSPPPGDTHVDNPYAGARGYVNPDWANQARADGGAAIANQSTGIWLDRIAAIAGTSSAMGLRAHLDDALTQAGGQPLTIPFVIYDLPGRDCAALASNGELGPTEIGRYRSEYIDPIAAIMADTKYRNLRIVTIIEIDSLPNLVTNAGGTAGSTDACATMKANGNYVAGIQYALNKLHAISNVYTYIDAAHHAWLGWDSNFGPSADLFASTVRGTTAGFASVDGFITNTANYSALTEPNFNINTTVNGQSVKQSHWVDFNQYVDELSYAQAFRTKLVSEGFNANLGMLIDTSRNGWGGAARPTGPSTSTDVNTFVDASRIDRRIHAGNWCNQSGAGLGERPRANPASGIDAYVWIKPPGESDGSSTMIPNNDGKGFDRMCDPTYTGNARNGNSMSGALPNAPLSGAWFSAQFHQLMANAFPAL